MPIMPTLMAHPILALGIMALAVLIFLTILKSISIPGAGGNRSHAGGQTG